MKKILVAAALLSSFLSSPAPAQVTSAGQLLFPGSNDSMLVGWGTDTVNAFLGMHQIPTSQWTVIQQYGRQDIYDDLRAFAWLRIQAMINSSSLTTQEQYVLNRFAADATTLSVSALQDAVNEKNNYLANKCTWQPDPTIATQAGYSYNGADYCPSVPYNVEQFDGPPPVSPPKEYFLAYGQKAGWLNPITTRPGGTLSTSHITLGGQLLLGIGISASILVGAAWFLAFQFVAGFARLILPFFKGTPVVAMIGGAIAIAIALVMIVIAIYAYTENARVEAEYPQLDQALSAAISANQYNQASLAAALKSPSGAQLVYATFLDEFVPSVSLYSTAALPTPNPPIDTVFVVGNSSAPSISFKGWQGETYTVQMWGGWFESTTNRTVTGVDSPSIGVRLRYLWNGVQYEAARSGSVFIASKVAPASTDVACPPLPDTGVSAATDFTTCTSFTTTSLPMDLLSGTQNVSLYQAPAIVPVTDPFSPSWTDGFSLGQSRQISVTATGIPTPTITASNLPAGFNFGSTGAGSGTLSWSGTGSAGHYSIQFQASNGEGSTAATMSASVYTPVKIIQPGSDANVNLTLTAGTPYTIKVIAVGSPEPGIEVNQNFATCGLNFPQTSGSTLTMSGTIAFPIFNGVNLGSCTFNVKATNSNYFLNDNACNCGYDEATITINVVQPPSQPILVTTTANVPVAKTTQTTVYTSGGTGTVQISLTQGSNGQLAPAWVSLADNGNGTATLTMTPPANAPASVLVPLWYRVANTTGNQATDTTDGVTVTVNKTPSFDNQPTSGYVFVLPTSSAINQNISFQTTNLSGTLGTADTLPARLFLTNNSSNNTLNIQGVSGDPGLFQTSLVASNSSGSSSAPLQIVTLQPATITSVSRVNFYMGQSNSFTLTATGFPQNSIGTIPTGTADPLRFSASAIPPGLQLQTSDPTTGANYQGYALLTGTPPNSYSVYTFPVSAQTGNNTSISPVNTQNLTVVYTHPGDVNGDGVVGCADITYVTSRYGQETGMTNYDYNADYNHDGVINAKDLAMVSTHLPKGTRCN
jgi:hypothetical protein